MEESILNSDERDSSKFLQPKIRNRFEELGIKPPKEDEYTIGEIKENLVVVSENLPSNLGVFIKSDGVIYPHILIKGKDLKERPPIQIPDSESVISRQRIGSFINQNVWRKLLNFFLPEENNPFSIRQKIRKQIITFLMFYDIYITPNLINPAPNTLQSDPRSGIKTFAWHKYKQIFAVGLINDGIYIYDLNIESWLPFCLRHEFQRKIYCMEWKPNAGNILAIGTSFGICLWSLHAENRLVNGQPLENQNGWMEYLRYPGHAPVTSLSFSPSGRYLATGSPNDSAVIIWDLAFNNPTILRYKGGVTLIKWSPNENYLFAATSTTKFRVWETHSWTVEKFALSSPIQTACWSPNGKILMVSTIGESSFHCIGFTKNFPILKGQYLHSEDIGPYNINNGIQVGGAIKQLEWDPTGERLAISFLDEGNDFIAIYTTKFLPLLEFEPRGFIRGPDTGGKPCILAFRPNFPKGALLATCWLNGKISFYPFYFTPIDIQN